MKKTIGFEQSLNYENVISTYYLTSGKEIGKCLEVALQTIFDLGYSLSQNFFYSTNSDIRNQEELLIQVFMPVNEDNQDNLPEDYRFQSYFQVNNMIATRVKGDNSKDFSKGIEELLMFVADGDLEPTSPMFYRPQIINDQVYTDLMLRVR